MIKHEHVRAADRRIAAGIATRSVGVNHIGLSKWAINAHVTEHFLILFAKDGLAIGIGTRRIITMGVSLPSWASQARVTPDLFICAA
jgi:hypothetical protein